MNLSAMFDQMIVLFAAILIGYLITKLGVMDKGANKVLSADRQSGKSDADSIIRHDGRADAE